MANLTAAAGAGLSLADNNRYLSWSQLGLTQQTDGLVSNAGIGQRWVAGNGCWATTPFTTTCWMKTCSVPGWARKRGGKSAPVGELLSAVCRLARASDVQEQRMARGYDVTAKAWLPWFHHLNTSVSVEQYFGDNVDLFNSGTGYHNPVAVNLGLNYTPVPLVTLTPA
jgi:hypothetical protein